MFRDSRFRILFRFRVLWPQGCRVKGIGLGSCVSVRAGVLDHNSRIQRMKSPSNPYWEGQVNLLNRL